MWGYDIEDEEAKNFKELREYQFFIYGEPEIEVVVGGLKTTLPVSKLGLSYYKGKMETNWDTFRSSTDFCTSFELVDSQDIKLHLLTIKGTATRRHNRDNLYQDLSDLQSFSLEIGPYMEEYKKQSNFQLDIGCKETQYSCSTMKIDNFTKILKLFNLGD